MARTHKPVNRTLLETCLKQAEEGGALANRQILYASVSERYNVAIGPSDSSRWITPSIVLLRIGEWGLSPLTPKGQRGRPKGSKISPKLDANGNPIARKRKARRASSTNLDAMRAGEFSGDQYKGLLQRIENGSLTARVKANCLACAGFVREEIKHCQCTGCPLWDVRPYQTLTSSGDDSEETIGATVDIVDDSSTLEEAETIAA